jgi:SAM-dependent methyltransferase
MLRWTLMEPESFSYSGTELTALANARNYYQWIFHGFAPSLGRRTIEVGAGVGTFSQLLLRHPALESLVLVEPAANLFPILQARYAKEPRATLVHGYLEDVPESVAADCIVAINVLEHIADDTGFLSTVRARLVPGGNLLLLVPAGPRIFGTLDAAFGHYRRYTRNSLSSALQKADFRVDSLRYFNFPGILTWYLAGRVLRKRTLLPRDVALYDRWVVPWLSLLESVWRPPLGQSLMAVVARH